MVLITPYSSIACYSLQSVWPWEASGGIFILLHGECWRDGGQAATCPQPHAMTLLQAWTTLPPASSLGPSNPIHSPPKDLPATHIWCHSPDPDPPWFPLPWGHNPRFFMWFPSSLKIYKPSSSTPTMSQAAWTLRCLNLLPGLPYAILSACDTFHLCLDNFLQELFPDSSSLGSVSPLWALLQTLSESPARLKNFGVKDCFFFIAVSPMPSTEMAWNKYLGNEMSEWMNKWVNVWVITCCITSCKIFLIHVCEINWINEGGKPAIGIPGEEWTLALELCDRQVHEKQRKTLCRKLGNGSVKSSWAEGLSINGLSGRYPETSHPIPTHCFFFRAVFQAKAGIFRHTSGSGGRPEPVVLHPRGTSSQLHHPEGRRGCVAGSKFH